MGWVSICFFGLGTLIGFAVLFDRRPQIIINENGIWDRTTKQDQIKWEQIIDAYPLEIFNQKFISIVTDDTFHFKKKPHKWTTKLNKAVGAQNININLTLINIEINELNKLINQLIIAENKDRERIIRDYKTGSTKSKISIFLKIPLYILISTTLLLISTTGFKAFFTIMIITGLSAITARWFKGSTNNPRIRKYAEINTWFGFINIILIFPSINAYDYVSENVGKKISAQIETYKEIHSVYPTNLDSIKELPDLNLIEKEFAKRIAYIPYENDYKLTTKILFNKKQTYNTNTGKWE